MLTFALIAMLDPIGVGILYLRDQADPLDSFQRAVARQTCAGEDTGDYMVRVISHQLKTEYSYAVPFYCMVQVGR